VTLVLDAGALIALERNDRPLVVLLRRAIERGDAIVVPAGVVAQVWRDPARQVRLVRFLNANGVEIAALDGETARAAGELLGAQHSSDVVDASVVILAHQHDAAVVTSDADDIRRLSASLRVIAC
jgi:predicted nucleic acid-binding protein